MSQKRGIIISCLCCAAIVAAVLGIYCLLAADEKPVQTAQSCGQLELCVHFSSEEELIRIWRNEQGEYYYFLPAGAKSCDVTFANLDKGGTVLLDGESFGRGDDLRGFLDSLQPGQTVKMTMGGGIGGYGGGQLPPVGKSVRHVP